MTPAPHLGSYYFRAHSYTLVPHQVTEDMQWLANHGTKAVIIGILEQDLTAARENFQIIGEEAEKCGMDLWITPSRWGNLVAGCPKVPSLMNALHHELWATNVRGEPIMNFLGPIASVHHPETFRNFQNLLSECLQIWPVKGIIWDEPKNLWVRDYSPSAKDSLGSQIEDPYAQMQAQCAFFGEVSSWLKTQRPDILTGLFTFGNENQDSAQCLASQKGIDLFGCDGRPWPLAAKGPSDSGSFHAVKSLIDDGPRFQKLAADHGKKSLCLIENHALPHSALPLVEEGVPQVLEAGWDWVLFYYYPRSCENPKAAMETLGKALKAI